MDKICAFIYCICATEKLCGCHNNNNLNFHELNYFNTTLSYLDPSVRPSLKPKRVAAESITLWDPRRLTLQLCYSTWHSLLNTAAFSYYLKKTAYSSLKTFFDLFLASDSKMNFNYFTFLLNLQDFMVYSFHKYNIHCVRTTVQH